MTSTIKVNNIQNQCGQNIINENSNTITIGASGDTIALASGASQTGFGRTGTVDWQTSIKTSTITAVNGEGYFVNTTGGAITANLPAGTAGSIVAFKDYLGTFDTNALTIAANGSQKINGDATTDLLVDTEGESLTLVYADDTQGWLVVNDGNNDAGAQTQFISATGGTITTVCTNFKVHTFTGPGTFTVTCAGNALGSNTVSYLVIGGGGGSGNERGGGGGAGGFRESKAATDTYTASPLNATSGPTYNLPVSAQGYPITVGGGGGPPAPGPGPDGVSSVFSSITAAGGGGGGYFGTPGANGGSGGGGSDGTNGGSNFGTGNTPPVSPPQGQNGGPSTTGSGGAGAGGGGGAGAAGSAGSSSDGGAGGNGVATSITGSPVTRAGGGGGGLDAPGSGSAGAGGSGGGGAAGKTPTAGTAGTANTGGGGGGTGYNGSGGANGGSGIVIIRYKFQ